MCSGIDLGGGAGALRQSRCPAANPFDQIHAPPKRWIARSKVTTSSHACRIPDVRGRKEISPKGSDIEPKSKCGPAATHRRCGLTRLLWIATRPLDGTPTKVSADRETIHTHAPGFSDALNREVDRHRNEIFEKLLPFFKQQKRDF